ncbi:MAG: DUF308 domain-containing protein [Clostridia bacterium]|nr:DUF308 domain-containing protein [Clostridia bacterium]
MKKFLKKLKAGMMFSGLFSLILGLILIFSPEIVTGALSYILGGGLALFGLLEIVFVFVRPNGLFSIGRMIPGILSLAVGLVCLFQFELFLSLLWMLMGVAILIDAVYKLQYAFELKNGGIASWWINLLVSLIALIFASVLIIKPFEAQNTMTVFAGILLAVNGLFDMVTVGMMGANADKMNKQVKAVIRDAEEQDSKGSDQAGKDLVKADSEIVKK